MGLYIKGRHFYRRYERKIAIRDVPVLSLMILRKKFVPSYLFSFKLHCREGS